MLKSKATLDDIEKNLDDGIAGADAQRAEHLRNFQTAREAKANLYEREQARLTLKYGADHPRVLALSNKISVNRGIVNEVEQERVRAAVPVPDVDDQTFIVHGFVRDENGIGMANMTVAFYDRDGRAVQRLGYDCTKATGYFKISATDLGSTVFDRVYLGVSQHGARIYNDTTTLTPQPGTVIYREIRLRTGGGVCPPPDNWDDPNPTLIGGGGNGGNGGNSDGNGGGNGGDNGGDDGGGEEGGTDEAHPASGPGVWTVRGRVTDRSGRGASGLTVSLYDEDLIFDDLLDETVTDEHGNYSFTYHTEDFRDLIEKKPDLYLKVLDRKGRTLYDSECDVRFEANRTEVVDIDLSD
ncbi:MAG TPA: hypothetical protein VGC91_12390 [Pyrinomonadaceae bacterium]|jgi:hypothetical protein